MVFILASEIGIELLGSLYLLTEFEACQIAGGFQQFLLKGGKMIVLPYLCAIRKNKR
jgi:hypothetical protein